MVEVVLAVTFVWRLLEDFRDMVNFRIKEGNKMALFLICEVEKAGL